MPAKGKRRVTPAGFLVFALLALLVRALIAHSDRQTGQPQSQPVQTANNDPEAIPLKVQGGTLLVPILINGQIPLDFTIDGGASYVSIPADVVLYAKRISPLPMDQSNHQLLF
jgi:hypothetical protein